MAAVAVGQLDAAGTRGTRRAFWLCAAIIVAAVVAVYAPVLRHRFVLWDDQVFLFANSDFEPPTLTKVLQKWGGSQGELFMPATQTVWAAVATIAWKPQALGGRGMLDPMPFHAASMVVHALAAVAGFALLRRLTGNTPGALCGAMLFALHPVQAEAVAWASELKDLLCAMFSLLALNLYVGFAQYEVGGGPDAARRRSVRRALYVWSTLLFVLAMLSKPSAIALPLLAIVIDRGLVRRPWKTAVLSALPWAVLAVPVVVTGIYAQPNTYSFRPPLHLRPMVALDALAFYAAKIVWPAKLATDYARSPQWLLANDQVYFTWIVPVAIGIACFAARRRAPWLGPALLLTVAAVLPVLGLVPFSFQGYSTVADHYLYLAMIGPALVVTCAIRSMFKRHGWISTSVTVVALIVLTLLGIRSRQQAMTWRDSATLFAHTIEVSPRSHMAAQGMLETVIARGQWAQAAAMLRRTTEMRDVRLEEMLAEALIATGQYDAAREVLSKLLSPPPWTPEPPNPLVKQYLAALSQVGNRGTTRPALLDRRPWTARYLVQQALFYAMLGDVPGAIELLEAAVREDPQNQSARGELLRTRQLLR